MDIVSKEYIIEESEKKYSYMNSYLIECQQRVTDNYRIQLINAHEKYQLMKRINSIFRKLENVYYIYTGTYDDNLINYNDDSDSSSMLSEHTSDTFNNSEEVQGTDNETGDENITKQKTIKKKKTIHENKKNPFDKIKIEITNLCQSVGFLNLRRGLELIIGKTYRKAFSHENLQIIDFYDKYFVPTSYYNMQTNKIDKPYVSKNLSLFKKNLFLYLNGAEVHIPNIKNIYMIHNKIVFRGYFIDNILHPAITSNNYPEINEKREQLFRLLDEICPTDVHFKEGYLKKYKLSYFLSENNVTMKENIENNYKKLKQLKNSQLSNTVTQFTKGSIIEMYDILSLLLSNSQNYKNIAYLLYNIIKSKNVNGVELATILFDNLHYTFQHSLKKTTTNVNRIIKRLRSITIDDIDFDSQIAVNHDMPMNIKTACLTKIRDMKPMSNDFSKQLLFVRTLLDYPWPQQNLRNEVTIDHKKETRIEYIDSVKNALETLVYGHWEAKKTLLRTVGKWMANPKGGEYLGLYGPPGVGKTLLATSIGKALGLPFGQILLGGQNDAEILIGHGYTYSSAQPGMLIKKLVDAKQSRCIIYFDELDKTGMKNGINEIDGVLINITDVNTNKKFQDRFFQGIEFDLSNVLFIFSYNDPSKINKVLLDRLIKIETKPHTLKDKIVIAKKFMLPEILKDVNFAKKSITIEDDVCEFLIEKYTYEPGVRELKRLIYKIVLELNICRIYETDYFANNRKYNDDTPLLINNEMITKFLEKPTDHVIKIHSKPSIGVINGLYATVVGIGGITPVQIFPVYADINKRFDLDLTGSQGDVMKESIKVAFTVAWNMLDDDERNKLESGHSFKYHVHAPSASTKKDGPSAGCAFTIAFLSRFRNVPIRNEVAMTGEIELTGEIKKIGGLGAKLIGAKKAGVKLCIIPEENKDDLDKLIEKEDKLIDDEFKVITISNIYDAFEHILI